MQTDHSIRPDSSGFSQTDILACMEREGLLSITIALPRSDVSDPTDVADECTQSEHHDLTTAELLQIITQATAVGCRRVSFLEHPRSSWPDVVSLVNHAIQSGLEVEWFARPLAVDAARAQQFFDRRVTVVLPIHSLDPQIENTIQQDPQAHTQLQRTLEALARAGYGKPDSPVLAACISLCPANCAGLPELWRWLRGRGIQPWLQIITPNRLAAQSGYLLDPIAVQKMFTQLRDIDQREFAITWALPANASVRADARPLHGCHVLPNGVVLVCAGLNIPIGHVRQASVGQILEQSETLENLRLFATKLKAPCGEHVHEPAQLCSRASAWQLTGDYFAGDPLCHHAVGQLDRIGRLPVSVASLIPHGPSMRAIDTLNEVTERYARTQWTIPASSPLVNDQGRLDDTAYTEMIAQSFAASHGFHLTDAERANHRGLLLGIKNLTIHQDAHVGDTLDILTHRVGRFANFGIVHGRITRADGSLVAQGEVKIWRPPNDDENPIMS